MPRSTRRSRRRPIVPRRAARPRREPPSAPPLRITVEQHATVALVRITGEFDIGAVEIVERALRRAVDGVTDEVVIDLRGLSFFDLAGLETVLRASERGRRRSYRVAVVPPAAPARRIITVTQAERSLTLVDAPPV
jgi:anti-anti-sigma factor